MHYDVVIVSDLHLGAALSNGKKFKTFLKEINTKKLILLGDIFQDTQIRRLKRYEWKILTEIRKMINERHTEVIWVEGNHDFEILDIISALTGIDVYERYEFNIGDKKSIAIHGHQFHFHLPKSRFINKIGQYIYLKIQDLDKDKNKKFSLSIEKLIDKFSDSDESVKSGAIKYAKHHELDYIFCGHTHNEIYETEENIIYINTGAWLLDKSPYVGIIGKDIKLLYY